MLVSRRSGSSVASTSACNLASTAGCCDSRYHTEFRTAAVVSCPATMIDITSSISSRCDMALPSLRSRAAIIIRQPIAVTAASGGIVIGIGVRLRLRGARSRPRYACPVAESEMQSADRARLSSVSSANGLAPRSASRRSKSAPRVARSTTSSAPSLVSRVTLSSSPLAAFSAHAGQPPAADLGDQGAEALDPRALEHRLHHSVLAFPHLTFADDDAVADQQAHAIQAAADGVVAVIGHQHALDGLRIRHDPGIAVMTGRMHAIDVTELRAMLQHACQRIVGLADIELRVRARRAGVIAVRGSHGILNNR